MDTRDKSIMLSYAKDLAVAMVQPGDAKEFALSLVEFFYPKMCELLGMQILSPQDKAAKVRQIVTSLEMTQAVIDAGMTGPDAAEIYDAASGDEKKIEAGLLKFCKKGKK